MKVEKIKLILKTDEYKFKIRKEGRRMKIYVKLSKAETERWNMLKSAVVGKEGNMNDEDFAKIMLFRGINGFMDDINTAMDEMSDEEKAQVLKEAGIETASEIEVEVPVTPDPKETDENTTNADEHAGEDAESSPQE